MKPPAPETTDTSICVAPTPADTWVTVAGRPFEFWEPVQPLNITETGRRHHRRPRVLGFTEAEIADLLEEPRGWPNWLRLHGEPDQGPYRAALMRQRFGPQPDYIARVGLDNINAQPETTPPTRTRADEAAWQYKAACRNSADEFVDVTQQTASALIDRYCEHCPTRVPCAALGVEQTDIVGSVWGGRFIDNRNPR